MAAYFSKPTSIAFPIWFLSYFGVVSVPLIHPKHKAPLSVWALLLSRCFPNFSFSLVPRCSLIPSPRPFFLSLCLVLMVHLPQAPLPLPIALSLSSSPSSYPLIFTLSLVSIPKLFLPSLCVQVHAGLKVTYRKRTTQSKTTDIGWVKVSQRRSTPWPIFFNLQPIVVVLLWPQSYTINQGDTLHPHAGFDYYLKVIYRGESDHP